MENMKEGDEKEEFDLKEIYTPIHIAKEEIQRRWKDKKLRKKVSDFLNGDKLDFLDEKPKAFFVRHIASPNKETLNFLDVASDTNLELNILEYCSDKFVAKNKAKYFLGKLVFYDGIGKNNGEKISNLKVINFNSAEGKSFTNIDTNFKCNLVDFHHSLLSELPLTVNYKVKDISQWLSRNGDISKRYYLNFLALFICGGILFENYVLDEKEKKFTLKIVVPAFKMLKEIFGVAPLIVPFIPLEDADSDYWNYYPEEIKVILKKKYEKH